jgi:acetoin utilization protein AcuA
MLLPAQVRIERLQDPGRIDVPPGFFAVNRSAELREALSRVLDLGAWVTCALHGSVLLGYALDLPFVPVSFDGVPWPRRWDALPDARELGAIEIARPYRDLRLGHGLLAGLCDGGRLEGQVLIGEGLVWHWDAEARGLGPGECRRRLLALFASAGFRSFRTDEPNIAESPYNFLVARIGSRVPAASRAAFEAALLIG